MTAVRSSAGPVAASPSRAQAPPSAHWSRCAAGFRATTRAEVDVLRLGLACGPSNGMVRLGPPMAGAIDEDGREGRHETERIAAGDCIRLAVAADDVADLEVELARPGAADEVERATVDRRWALVPEHGPLCVTQGGALEVTVRTYSGGGSYVVDAWHFP